MAQLIRRHEGQSTWSGWVNVPTTSAPLLALMARICPMAQGTVEAGHAEKLKLHHDDKKIEKIVVVINEDHH